MLYQRRAWGDGSADRGVWRAAVLCLLWALLLVPAWGAEKVRVGVYQNSPKVALSATGKAEGIFIDLIEGIAAREGWAIEYVPGTWAEGLERLERGEIDLMPDVARNQEREARYAFHQEPVLSSWNQVYTRRDAGLRTMLDLQDKKVAVLAGSVQERQFEQMASSFSLVVEWVPLPDYDAAFAAVAQGRADAVVTNRFFGVRNALRYGLEDTAIIFSPSKLFFAAPLGGRQEPLAAIDRHLVDFKKDAGSLYYKSLRRWSLDEVRAAATPAWLRPTTAAIAVALLAALAGVLLLRRQVALRTRELSERNREILVINDTLRAMGARRDLDGVLQEAAKGALALADFDGGVLCLRDGERGMLMVGARLHAPSPRASGTDGGFLCDAGCPAMLDVVGPGQPHALVAADDPGAHPACGNARDTGIRWNAYFALQVQDRPLGVLYLFSRQAVPPSPAAMKRVEDLCGPVALAIENAHLHQQAQQHAQELERRVEERTRERASAHAAPLKAMHRAEDTGPDPVGLPGPPGP